LQTINQGIQNAFVKGRYQSLLTRQKNNVELMVDVAHNPQAARLLKQFLSNKNYNGKTHAIFSILEDKDVSSVIAELKL